MKGYKSVFGSRKQMKSLNKMVSAIFTKKDKLYWTTTLQNGKCNIDHLKLAWMNLPLFRAGQVMLMFKE